MESIAHVASHSPVPHSNTINVTHSPVIEQGQIHHSRSLSSTNPSIYGGQASPLPGHQRAMSSSDANLAFAPPPGMPDLIKGDDAISAAAAAIQAASTGDSAQSVGVVKDQGASVSVASEPSSNVNTALAQSPYVGATANGTEQAPLQSQSTTIISMQDNGDAELLSGYLNKKTRNGTWQRRYFVADGERLCYYKSKKKTKVLATLALEKVGVIAIDAADHTGSTFAIQVKNRPYFLQAENKEIAEDWVIQLNRLREASFGIGGISLFNTSSAVEKDVELVLTTNRQRSHAVNNAQDLQAFIQNIPDDPTLNKWRKGSQFATLRSRVSRWARGVLSCLNSDANKHVVRPGDAHAHSHTHNSDINDNTVGSEVSGGSTSHEGGGQQQQHMTNNHTGTRVESSWIDKEKLKAKTDIKVPTITHKNAKQKNAKSPNNSAITEEKEFTTHDLI